MKTTEDKKVYITVFDGKDGKVIATTYGTQTEHKLHANEFLAMLGDQGYDWSDVWDIPGTTLEELTYAKQHESFVACSHDKYLSSADIELKRKLTVEGRARARKEKAALTKKSRMEESARNYEILRRRHKYLLMRLEQDHKFTRKEKKRWLEVFETPRIYGYLVEKTKKGYSIVSRSRRTSVGPFNFPELREVISHYQGVASVVAEGERHLENLETQAGAD